MNQQLFDFMTDLRAAETTDQAGQSFIAFTQKTGASAVHTFFGTAPDKQSVSTLPASSLLILSGLAGLSVMRRRKAS